MCRSQVTCCQVLAVTGQTIKGRQIAFFLNFNKGAPNFKTHLIRGSGIRGVFREPEIGAGFR